MDCGNLYTKLFTLLSKGNVLGAGFEQSINLNRSELFMMENMDLETSLVFMANTGFIQDDFISAVEQK